MSICSVCTVLPTTENPTRGLFVNRRLTAMAKNGVVRGLNPQPYFPFFKSWQLQKPVGGDRLSVESLRMPYLPGIGNRLNGRMLQFCVSRWLNTHASILQKTTILDAHFGYPEGVGCYLVAQQLELPVFITIRGLEQPLFGSPIGDQIVSALNGCTGVIAVSESLRIAAINAGVNSENIKVIPNGVDHSVFTPPKSKGRGSTKLLVSVGNLKKVKGHDTLLRAFSRLSKNSRARLVIIGADVEPAYASRLRRMVAHLQLEQRVELAGALSEHDIRCWLQRANLFVLASRREGCCNAVLEALACGVPVVATKVGDNGVYVQEGINGRLVETDDEQGLATAIELTLQESHDELQIAKSVDDLTWNNTAESVLHFFQERLEAR